MDIVTRDEFGSLTSERWFSYPSELDFMSQYCAIRNDEDVYCSVAVFSDRVRTKDDPHAVTHTVYADADTCDPENFRVPPSIVVSTRPDRWHAWWLLDEEVPAAQASEASHRISLAHKDQGVDNGWIVSKLLRVPGTSNTKDDQAHPVTAIYNDDVYTLDTLLDVYHDIDVMAAYSNIEVSDEVPARLSKAQMLALEEDVEKAGLSSLYLERPRDGQSWSERLYRLELELFRLGMTPQEVFNLARESSANKYNPENAGARTQTGVIIPKRNNPDLVLWKEVQKAYAEAQAEAVEPTEERTITRDVSKPEFLSLEERKYVQESRCFIDEYVDFVAARTDSAETYQRSFAFLLLSSVYGGRGYIPLAFNPHTELNLWILGLGVSTTDRKTTALNFFLRAIHAYEAQTGQVLDIGSDATGEGLVKALGMRDGEVSVLHKDEVSGMFHEFMAKSYMVGTVETFTALYEGRVPVSLRATKDSGNRNRARTVFNFAGVGIRNHVAEVLTKRHFESGFLARFLWSVADPRPRKPGSESVEHYDEDVAESEKDKFDAEMTELIRPMVKNTRKWSLDKPKPIKMDTAALNRYNRWIEDGMKLAESFGEDEVLVPSYKRMTISVYKASALLAMHDGTDTVTLKHLLPTLAQAELWFMDMTRMAAEVSSSDFERRLDEVESFIITGEDKKRTEASTRKRFARFKPNEFDEIIRALQAAGRVRRDPNDRNRLEAL